jgi:hypothetical protein
MKYKTRLRTRRMKATGLDIAFDVLNLRNRKT